jgi:large subunit ribosomal protein L1
MAVVNMKEVKKVHGKRYASAFEKSNAVNEANEMGVSAADAFKALADLPKTKFDETVEVSCRLNVDPKQADQNIRGAVTLPHGSGKKSVVVVFAKGPKAEEAKAAGADHVGDKDLVEKIQGGWTDFTSVVATPDMMAVISRLGRVLGPRGLMPNPKVGTVTMNVKNVVSDLKKGRAEFRVEKAGVIHSSIGKASFGAEKLLENFESLMEQVVKAKPSSAKGNYILSLYISTTMGPSVRINTQTYLDKAAA